MKMEDANWVEVLNEVTFEREDNLPNCHWVTFAQTGFKILYAIIETAEDET